YLWGEALQQTDPEAALPHLQRATALSAGKEAGNAAPWLRLGEGLLTLARYGEAAAQLQRARALGPENPAGAPPPARPPDARARPADQPRRADTLPAQPVHAAAGVQPARGGPPAPRQHGPGRHVQRARRRPAARPALARPLPPGVRPGGRGPLQPRPPHRADG